MGKDASKVEKTTNHSSVFLGMALDMSWRLALVVLVPIIGGFKLDQAFNTAPLLAIIGFILALAGMAMVMWRTLQVASEVPMPKKKDKEA